MRTLSLGIPPQVTSTGKRWLERIHYTALVSHPEAAYLYILVESNNYTMQVTPVGELLFKLLMQNSVINKRNTEYHLR